MLDQLSLGVHSPPPFPPHKSLVFIVGMLNLDCFRFWVKKMFKLEPADSRLPMVSWLRKSNLRISILTLPEQEVDMS